MEDLTPLARRLRERIERDGPVPTHEFMRVALHDPEHGYYAKGTDIGARGDFYTSSNVSLFAPAIRRFVDAARERLGAQDARVVELGGGTGSLAAELGEGVVVVEPNEGMARQQRERGLHVVASLDELEPAPTVFFANEVLDALPVHRLRQTPQGLREGHVAWRDGRFAETGGPLTRPELERAAERYHRFLEEGAVVDVNLDAAPLLEAMARAAPRAIALFVDYGGGADELFGAARPQGTLRGYHQHQTTEWWERPGEQDLTADVDFDWVASLGAERGWTRAGYRTQGEFLSDLGLVEDMSAALATGDANVYMAAKNLLFPGGMGERFKALALARGVPSLDEAPLAGFRPTGRPGMAAGWRP